MSALTPISAKVAVRQNGRKVPLPEVGGISIAIAVREAIADDALRRLAAKRDDPLGRQPPEMPSRAERCPSRANAATAVCAKLTQREALRGRHTETGGRSGGRNRRLRPPCPRR